MASTQGRMALGLGLVAALAGAGECFDFGAHAKIGGLIGEQVKTEGQAFAAGFGSHIIADHINYGSVVFWGGEVVNGRDLPITVLVNAALSYQTYRAYKKKHDKRILYGALGGVAPDIIDWAVSGDDDDHFFGWHNRSSTLLHNDRQGAVQHRVVRENWVIGAVLYTVKF